MSNELDSFYQNAGLDMSVYKLSRRNVNVNSDIGFLEKCVSNGVTPNGFKWNVAVQGMDEETKEKAEKIKIDAESRLIDVVLKGMKEKKARLKEEMEQAVDRELEKRKGWEATRWVERVDQYQQRCEKEAEGRKRKKIAVLLEKNKCRKRDIDASGLCVKDIQDIPGLMDISD